MSSAPEFDPGLAITVAPDELAFEHGPGVFGPRPELRTLDAIRPSLLNPRGEGPDPVYGIAMDFGRNTERSELEQLMLLFGAVVYAAGTLGAEPVRSQGHVHAASPHSGWSRPRCSRSGRGRRSFMASRVMAMRPGGASRFMPNPATRS